MELKSQENLEAARVLVEPDPDIPEDTRARFPNAAASRAYYAAYLGTWSGMTHRGIKPPQLSNGSYFPHRKQPSKDGVPGFPGLAEWAEERGVLDDASAEKLRDLHRTRVKADYYIEDVDDEEAQRCIEDAQSVIAHVFQEDLDA